MLMRYGRQNVETVMRHYFNLDMEFMAEMVNGWTVPQADIHDEAREHEWLH
jgi:hypothetical protein